jgi:hypothetical protein
MMSISMDNYLGIVSPFLAPVLVDREAWSRLRAVARLLPPCSLAGLELRLRDDRPAVDFFARLPYANHGLTPPLLDHAVWRDLARLCDGVAGASELLSRHVARVFLEFDLGAPPPPAPTPALFLQLGSRARLEATDLLAIVDALDIHGHRSRASARALDGCLRALPPGAIVEHLGVMLSRPGAPLRVVVNGTQPAAIPGYLDAMGWRDATGQLSALVGGISPYADAVAMLDLDVADALGPKIGVEFYVRRENENRPGWEALFASLQRVGLAGPAKTAAILEWPGRTQKTGGGTWPANLAPGDLLLRGAAASVFWRNINHVKLGYQPGQEPEVKAYLGFGHNWFPAAPVSRPA